MATSKYHIAQEYELLQEFIKIAKKRGFMVWGSSFQIPNILTPGYILTINVDKIKEA